MTDIYSTPTKMHPLVRHDRFYIGDSLTGLLVMDQPQLGFKAEGACDMYIRTYGRHVASESYVCVPGTRCI